LNFAQLIRQLAEPPSADKPLSEEQSERMFSAALDGGIPDLELGALLAALSGHRLSTGELIGLHRAASARSFSLPAPQSGARPIVIPAYGGARARHNLLPLLVLLLRRLDVPVLVHGTLESSGGVAAAYILRELGVLPCATLAQAEQALEQNLLAFVPLALLSPGLASLLALRTRLGIGNPAHMAIKLLEPFAERGVMVIGAGSEDRLIQLSSVLAVTGQSALLLRSCEGEPFADPQQRPQIDWFEQARRETLFEAEAGAVKPVPGLPQNVDAQSTSEWIERAMSGELPIPHPLVNQLACCLFAGGYTDDMNQAKAIAAVETGSLSTAPRSRSRKDPMAHRATT
jgi:anthranilate phosphoribosyltransferase